MYIVTGYVFIKTYHFVALKQNSNDIEHILTGSIVIGFIYCNIAHMIPFTISESIDNVLIVLSALVLSYLIATALRSRKIVYHILDKLKIRDTGNAYIWDDIMDNDYPMKVCITYTDKSYIGIVHHFESYSNSPHVILASYVVKDADGNIISDYLDDNTKIIILDTGAAESVEIYYHPKSSECKDIKNLCDYNKELQDKEQDD